MADDTAKAQTTGPKPQADDQMWFDISKELVQKSVSSIEDSAAKLGTFVSWLFTIYAAGATIGVALAKGSYPAWVTGLIASPSVVLILAYLFRPYV